MTQPTPHPHSQPFPQAAPHSKPAPAPFRPQPLASVSTVLRDYIQAAASGDRSSIFYLFAVVFASARAAVRCLADHYNANPRQRTFETYARLKYCLTRIPAIFYTLQHAPDRFLTPGQLRAITRARAVLAHIWRQPVDFAPLTPYLTSPENCPPPPRSVVGPSLGAPLRTPRSALLSSEAPHSALHTSSPDPLLLRNPGCALASVLLQLTAIYGLASTPVPAPRPASAAPAPDVALHATPTEKAQGVFETATPHPQSAIPNPQSAFHNPQSLLRPPP